ncbi:MAG: CDP-diacylglycerol--glycerol-3-phosphate 3-phosphatidyltransferase [Clostridia bacterium]|nr:CDP-diacylglycerol--glycerol-3-phosphate 3-phosphatidyltransferase [Clostridia bacterium]
MNTPNKLTLARFCITPVFLAVLLADFPHKFLCAAVIFAAASVTDAIDGKLARKHDQITAFGMLLDPVADKVLTTAAFLAFLKMDLCSVWCVMLILTREFAVTSMRLIASAQGVVIPANIFGKIKTATQMAFVLLILLLGEAVLYVPRFAGCADLYVAVSNVLVWITTVFAVVSGVIYFFQAKKRIDFFK